MRLAFIAFVVAVTGCHGAPRPAAPANRVETPAAEAISKDPLAFLPRESEVVIDLDGAKLKASTLWTSQIRPLLDKTLGSGVQALRNACGLDYVEATTRLSVGLRSAGATFTGVMVVRGPDAAATMTCIEQKAPGAAKVTRDGNALVVATSAPNLVAVAAVGPSTLVLVIDAKASGAMVADAIAAGIPLRSSPAFIALYDALPPNATLALIANGTSSLFEALKSVGVPPRWVVATATIDASYVLASRLMMPDGGAATNLAGMMQKNVSSFHGIVERLDVRAEGEVVHVDAAVTEAQAKLILGMLGLL